MKPIDNKHDRKRKETPTKSEMNKSFKRENGRLNSVGDDEGQERIHDTQQDHHQSVKV